MHGQTAGLDSKNILVKEKRENSHKTFKNHYHLRFIRKKMKTQILKQIPLITMGILTISSFSFATTDCTQLKGCAEKICQVNKQIVLAKKADNTNKLEGLNKALEEIKEHCSDDKIISDIEKDLSEAKEELAEHKEELKEAQAEQKNDKIEKYMMKIKEDEAEISSLQAQLTKMSGSH